MPEVVGRLPRLDDQACKPGIYFADDPAFKGKRRELVARDYVYAFKRFVDPALQEPGCGAGVETCRHRRPGRAARSEAIKTKKPFDYDREIEGMRALDRYTLQFRLAEPRPRFC